MIESIDDEVRFEQEIKDLAGKISRDLKLSISRKSNFEFMGRYFTATAKINNKEILLLVADREKLSANHNKYMPYKVEGTTSPDFTLDENLRALIEGFLRHLSGNPEVGEICD